MSEIASDEQKRDNCNTYLKSGRDRNKRNVRAIQESSVCISMNSELLLVKVL